MEDSRQLRTNNEWTDSNKYARFETQFVPDSSNDMVYLKQEEMEYQEENGDHSFPDPLTPPYSDCDWSSDRKSLRLKMRLEIGSLEF